MNMGFVARQIGWINIIHYAISNDKSEIMTRCSSTGNAERFMMQESLLIQIGVEEKDR